ncbi:AAA family ATPase, partial [bacterium]|nr:AAA family ATPase [bacterium]
MTPWDNPEYCRQQAENRRRQESEKLILTPASSVIPEQAIWVFIDWLLQGVLTYLVGQPGVGKTALWCLLAAHISRGKCHADSPFLNPTGWGHVLIISTEDDPATTLRPRLERAGADLDKVHFVDIKSRVGDETPFSFANLRHIERLVGHSERLGNKIGLLVIDPIYRANDGDPGNNYKARETCENLSVLSKRIGCPILGVGHSVRNPRGKEALARVAGAPALREVPRSIILLQKIADGPSSFGGTHVMVHAKNNNGRMDGGLEYRIVGAEIEGPQGPIQTVKVEVTRELAGSAED